jgi:hypothetical protein
VADGRRLAVVDVSYHDEVDVRLSGHLDSGPDSPRKYLRAKSNCKALGPREIPAAKNLEVFWEVSGAQSDQ